MKGLVFVTLFFLATICLATFQEYKGGLMSSLDTLSLMKYGKPKTEKSGKTEFLYSLEKIFAAATPKTEDKKVPFISTHYVQTRDGINLFTVTINPTPYNERKPAVLCRTPYALVTANIADLYLLDGYVAVLQDQRGAFLSGGQWDFWREDGQDGYDTIEWISQQDWSSGVVFSAGASADGNSALTQGLFLPPWLKSQFIIWATAEAHRTSYQGGAYRQSLLEGWLTAISPLTRLHSLTVINDVIDHEIKDEYWDTIGLEDSGVLPNITYPAIIWGGWYDIFQQGTVEVFNAVQNGAHPSVRGKYYIYMDPYGHCVGAGDADFPNALTTFAVELSRQIFAAQISESKILNDDPNRLYLYIMGTAIARYRQANDLGNYWTALPVWPKTTPTNFYLNVGSQLTQDPPTQAEQTVSYLYNPRDPAPNPGGTNLSPPCGVHPLVRLERRDDVAFWTSGVLNSTLAVVGNLKAVLYVESDAVDTDFVVYLGVVYDDDTSYFVQDGVQRMRWRETNKVPVTMKLGVVYEITVDMLWVGQIFNVGQRLRLYVTSSSSPRYSTNRNNGYLVGENGNFVSAFNTVHFSSAYPSHLVLPVVALADIPEQVEFPKRYAITE